MVMSINKIDDESSQIVAVFDFDGTITNRHTFWRYMRFVSGSRKFYLGILVLIPQIILVLMGVIPIMQARTKFIKKFLGGITVPEEQACAVKFVNNKVNKYLRASAMRRLRWHQLKGHQTILISNSPENYLVLWGNSVNFTHISGTRLEVKNGKLTGKVQGKDCVSGEKVERLKQIIGEKKENFFIFVYGDSSGDKELLEYANVAFYRNWY